MGSAFGAVIAASLWLVTAAAAEVVSPQAVGCKLIKNAGQLQAMRNDLAGSYCLANDIDASSIANFVPIGDAANPFTGKLFGNGRVIRNLTIESDREYVGLFGYVANNLIHNVGLLNADITGTASDSYVGGLFGATFESSEVRLSHVTGRVAATGSSSHAGSIVGVATRAFPGGDESIVIELGILG
jgi:hypothetical protein